MKIKGNELLLCFTGLLVILTSGFAGMAWRGSYHFQPIPERIILGYNKAGQCSAVIVDTPANFVGIRDCTAVEMMEAK